uniref:Middle T antigen n=1 Tax=Mus musculus TaxID=10090 RepID=Q04188_MOUSE|nr:middle T antigen [Mus musculus]
MDRVLSRADKERLLELLKLPRQLWGDFGRMQQAYKQQSLLLHPDKGGSHALMQELNSLWGTFKTEVYNLRMNLGGTGFQVRRLHADGWNLSTKDTFGDRYYQQFCRMPLTCLVNVKYSSCSCILCLLRKQHRELKDKCDARCLVLGECFCLECYMQWFGTPTRDVLNLYADFIASMPIDWLDLDVHSVYNPKRRSEELRRAATVHYTMTTGHSAMEASTSQGNGMISSESGTPAISRRLRLPSLLSNPTYSVMRSHSFPPTRVLQQIHPHILLEDDETLVLLSPMTAYPRTPPELLYPESDQDQLEPLEEEEEEYMPMEDLYLDIPPEEQVPQLIPPPIIPRAGLSPWEGLILRDLQRAHFDPILEASQRMRATHRAALRAHSMQRHLRRLGRTLLPVTFLAALLGICLMLFILIKRSRHF